MTIPDHLMSNIRDEKAHPKRFLWDNAPNSVDLRSQLPPIKDQGNGGSCWAFSMTSALEHQYYKAKGKVVSLSDQQVASCTNSLTNGCNGYNPLLGIILILYILKQ